ncbi:MAG: hypothetical protein IT381_23690 [Deltaproteobacteria bacterium]|nr:hypothetical protein [Deltaproteobacteria bacterium]
MAAVRANLPGWVSSQIDLELPASSWLPAAAFGALCEAAFDHGFERDAARMVGYGNQTMQKTVRGYYSMFIKMLSPEFVARRISTMWNVMFKNNGRAHVVSFDHAKRCAVTRYEGVLTGSPAFWLFQQGAGLGVLEMTRLKNLHVALESGGGNSGEASFLATWA